MVFRDMKHYLTGLAFAFIPAGFAGAGGYDHPTPSPARARLMSLLAHLIYGAGLYLTAGLLAQAGS